LYNLYKDELAVMRIQYSVEEAKINRGVGQGCTLSPNIFNAYIQEAIDMMKDNTNLGIKINGQQICVLRFTDDIALITENKEDLVQLIKTMDETFNNELDMGINVRKTKVMMRGRENRTRIQMEIRKQIIEQVYEFTYLGSTISNDGRNRSEIIKRICQAKIAFNNKKTIFT